MKHLLLKNLLRTLLRSVLLHDPLGVHPVLCPQPFAILQRVCVATLIICDGQRLAIATIFLGALSLVCEQTQLAPERRHPFKEGGAKSKTVYCRHHV